MTNKIKKTKFAVVLIFGWLFFIFFMLPEVRLTKAFSRTLPGVLALFGERKGKTPFDHDQHISTRANTTCVTCHHTNSKDLSVLVEEDVAKCATCHKEDDTVCEIEAVDKTKKIVGKKAIGFKDAFHGDTSEVGCIGCHEKRNIEPKRCDNCHTDADVVEYVITPLFPTVKDDLKPKPPAKIATN